jgi:voltage-gated potassium channel
MMNFPSKSRLAHIVFESDDKASKLFDILLLVLIFLSVMAAVLDSVSEIGEVYGPFLYGIEWAFTLVFTVEYLIRIWLSRRPIKYILSFYGLVDLLAILPAFLSLIIVNTQLFAVVRALRFLRVLRILKMGRHLREGQILMLALQNSRWKIQIFLGSVLTIVLVMGTLMFLIEGPENGYTSIPISMYWAIVTLTTVGFGDITPLTSTGKFAASIIMLLGYAIIAVPTGIVTSELTAASRKRSKGKEVECPTCHARDHDADAYHCKYCGTRL